jgi:hypothetical protein
MSCDIRSWGPSGWNLLHCVAAAYAAQPTDPQKANMLAFLHSLGKVLPCGSCGAHFTQGLREARLDSTAAAPLQSKQALFAWLVDQHNRVNRQRGKPQMSVEDAWKRAMHPVIEPTPTWLLCLLSVGITVLVMLYLMVVYLHRRRC